jgi:methylenetetrahydrofolate dehydrogenase (NADP+) / methenyltetrahydrofolate cyclohydrolase
MGAAGGLRATLDAMLANKAAYRSPQAMGPEYLLYFQKVIRSLREMPRCTPEARVSNWPPPPVLFFLFIFLESEPRMTARVLDGLKIRDQIFLELKDEITRLATQGMRPGLAAVLVGDNPASQLYVKSKIAACEQLGIASWLHTPPSSVSTEQMLALVDQLNRDDNVDGILIQLPLPRQVNTKKILEAVDPAKDVDGFHPMNLGKLVSGREGLVACTPAGCMEILRRNQISIEGANAVVLGRSDIVGKPMALLLMHANATVTICHSKTRDLPNVVRRADIVVAAMGKAGYVKADWLKPGSAVIDVGTNKITDELEAEELLKNFPQRLAKFREKGSVLIGDVHPDAVNTAAALTPVPGGVGPMTITMLMSNTVKAARLRRSRAAVGATQ